MKLCENCVDKIKGKYTNPPLVKNKNGNVLATDEQQQLNRCT